MSQESHGFALYSSANRQRNSLESSFQQSPIWDSTSSASGGDEPRSKPHHLNEEKSFSLNKRSYPRVFCNPVSDCDSSELHHMQEDKSTNPGSNFTVSTRNHQASPLEEVSPTPSNIKGSNEMLFDVKRSSESELGNTRNEPGPMTHHRCGVCKKLLSQRSPWCSYKILRCGDMPSAGVFPCHHVYHIECLDKVTPTAQARDPPCPVCSNTTGTMEQPLIVPETLELALRSLRRSRTNMETEPVNDNQRRHIRRRSKKWEKLSCCFNISFSSSS